MPYSWITYGHGSIYVLNLPSRLQEKSWSKYQWKCLEKDKLHKNPSVHFKEHYTSIDHVSLILYVSFSLEPRF